MQSGSRKAYEEMYVSTEHPLLYSAPWWLDAVCDKDGWDVLKLNDRNGDLAAYIPYYQTYISGLKAVITPPLTQWLSFLETKTSSEVSITDFLKVFPSSSILDITLKTDSHLQAPSSGLLFNTKYSYVIPFTEDYEHTRSKYNEGLRRNLKEAEKNYTIESSQDINTFLTLCTSSFFQRKMKPPSWLHHIVPVAYNALIQKEQGVLTFAFQDGKPFAGILTAWDHGSTYYLLGGRIADEGGASAHAFLLDNAIRKSHETRRSFDFEGSMHPGIANFFQSFGATPEPYWQIRKFKGLGKLWALFH